MKSEAWKSKQVARWLEEVARRSDDLIDVLEEARNHVGRDLPISEAQEHVEVAMLLGLVAVKSHFAPPLHNANNKRWLLERCADILRK